MVVRAEGAAEGLCPWRDGREFYAVVERALVKERRQAHRGRGCRREVCYLCDDLIGCAYEAVLKRYRKSGKAGGWAPGRIASAARTAYRDGVRDRLVTAGVGARPERWLGQKGFLPGVPAAGRALVVVFVLAVGYYSVLPASPTRFLVDDDVLGRALDGLRAGGQGLASVRKYWTFEGSRESVRELRGVAQWALEEWRRSEPKKYLGLLELNERNKDVSSLDELLHVA